MSINGKERNITATLFDLSRGAGIYEPRNLRVLGANPRPDKSVEDVSVMRQAGVAKYSLAMVLYLIPHHPLRQQCESDKCQKNVPDPRR